MERARRRPNRGRLMAGLAAALFVGFLVQESWAGRSITGDSLLFFLVVGVTIGSIYAVAASGLVVTYTTSGVFNFAQGAIGMFMAFVYWELKINAGIQTFLALCLTVLVAAPLMGLLIERLLMRRLASASLVAQLVVTIGLMLALIGIAGTIWDPNETRAIGTFFGSDGFFVGQTFLPYYRLITIAAALLLAVGFWLLLNRTRVGIAMRAVVDNRELAALNGASPARISAFAWMLGSAMAALAGIFLAEELSGLSIETLTLLIVDAFAAAIIGRLRSLPMTFIGGMIIGLSLSFQQNFLTWSGRWSSASLAIPTIILFLALLFLPQARIEGRISTAMKTARLISMKRALFGFVCVVLVMAVLAGVFERPDVRRMTLAVVTAVIMMSMVPLTGWANQISLAQITFVGIGAWATVEFSNAGGDVFGVHLFDPGSPLLLLVGAVVAVPFGVLMAFPALRLQGLYLALASMAFARMAQFVIFDQPEVFGGAGKRVAPLEVFGKDVSAPFTFLGIDFTQDAGFLITAAVLFGAVGMVVVWLRRGAFGRRLVAMRDSPAACATLGVNLLSTKLAVFALSAGIAGFGGALIGVARGSASTQNFEMLQGLPFLLLLVVGGTALVSGSLFGGIALQSFTWLVDILPTIKIGTVNVVQTWGRVGPGLAGIGVGQNPEGAVTAISAAVSGEGKAPPPVEGSESDDAAPVPAGATTPGA